MSNNFVTKAEMCVAYGQLGWKVFPCLPGDKKPAGKWKDIATSDTAKINSWFTQYPDHNVGIACGPVSNIVVIDLDVSGKKNGKQAFLDLINQNGGDFPSTVIAKTARGGFHLFFRYPEGMKIRNGVQKIGEGIDVRGDGGYVVGAPSVFRDLNTGEEGAYVWVDGLSPFEVQPAELPLWLLMMLVEDEFPDNPTLATDGFTMGGKIPAGSRNATLTVKAGAMRRAGFDSEDIYQGLRKHNASYCDPPLPDHEVKQIADSVGRYTPDPIASQPVKPNPLPNPWNGGMESLENSHQGNAVRFLKQHLGTIKYIAQRKKFIVWDGKRWSADIGNELAYRKAFETTESMRYYAELDPDGEAGAFNKKWAIKSQCKSHLDAMVTLAAKMEGMTAQPNDFDKDPDFLNTQDGILDLKTGALLPHDTHYMMSMITSCGYDPNMPIPHFLQFLNDIFDGNQELIEYMQVVLGYGLTGRTDSQCFWFWVGHGANGKSCMMRVMAEILQDYAMVIPPESLLVKNNSGASNDVAALRGKRFCTTSETSDTKLLDESKIKDLTGGGNSVTARFLFGEFFSFVPTLKIFFGTNHKPRIRGQDHGIWRRIWNVPFNHTFTPNNSIPETELLAPIMKEAPGILAWLQQGAAKWYADKGFKHIPKCVVEATQTYRQEEDMLGRFIEECCIVDKDARVATGDIYRAYTIWAKESGEYILAKTSFGKRISDRGFLSCKVKKTGQNLCTGGNDDRIRGYSGIKLLPSYNNTGIVEVADVVEVANVDRFVGVEPPVDFTLEMNNLNPPAVDQGMEQIIDKFKALGMIEEQ